MFSVIKKFNHILDKRQKKNIFILFLITLVGTFFEILGVSLMLPMITAVMTPDIIHTNKYIAWVCNLLDLHSHRTFVIACIAALILVFVVKNLFLIFQNYAQTRFVCNNRLLTQRRLMNAFMNKPYEYYLNASSGEIMHIISGDTGQTFTLLTTLLFMSSESIVSLGLIITIFVIDPKMTAFVAIMMLLLVLIITKVVRPVLKKEGIIFQESCSKTNNWLLQSISGIKEIKVSQKELFFETNYQKAGEKQIHSEKINTVANSVPRLLIEMVSMCSMLALIAIEIYHGRDIETLVPTLGAFGMAAVKLMPAANRIVGAANSVSFLLPSLDKLIENMEMLEKSQADISDILPQYTCSKKPHSIDFSIDKAVELKNITYRYPNTKKNILEDSSMLIPVGKSVGIVGTSGSGKTTAVDIMLGLLKPQKGTVCVDDVDVMNDYSSWLSHIGYIPQMIFMLNNTIRANIAFGIDGKEIDDTKIWNALSEAQLADFVRSLPKGLDTNIGERGINISGGQRQRIGIARALYSDPDLLLFDEATSALDNETEAAIMESINSLHGKKTMVIIAHRLQTIEGCDIVYRVQDGKIQKERG